MNSYSLINNIFFYFIILQSLQSVTTKKSYRVDHHLNVLGETEWETVPINIKEKSKLNTLYTNVKSLYNKSIVNPLNKYLSTYESNDKPNEDLLDIDYRDFRLKGEEAFSIDFNCKLDSNTCKKAERTFKKAAFDISEVLNIYSGPILINATLISFCEQAHRDGSACNADDPSRRKLGQAYPYSSYPAKAIDPEDGDTDIYLYPQALLRQLDIKSGMPDFSNYDIIAEFNSDVNWYFEGDDKSDRIDDDQHDFLYVATHELIHGLGFISSWRTLLDMDFEYLTPRVKTGRIGVSSNDDVVMGWYQMQIFDKYIQLNKTGAYLKDMGKKIMTYQNSVDMMKQVEWLEGFHKSESGQVAQEVYDIATSGKNTFSIMSKDNDLISYLQTIKHKFIIGTCMGHLDNDEYTNKPDFLLRPYVPKGEELEDLIEKGSFAYLNEEEKSRKDLWSKTAFGPHLVAVMETIGWPTKYHPERRSVEVLNGSLSRYVKNSWNIIIILLVSLYLILF